MSANRITVVVSQGQSAHPAKRKVEEDIVAGLLGEPGIDVTVVPNLYDLTPDGTGMLCLSGIAGEMIICSWLFPRAAHWTLDRYGIRGHVGETLIKGHGEEEDDDEDELDDSLDNEAGDEAGDEAEDSEEGDKERVADRIERPDRKIYCLDLRTHDAAEPYLTEIKRIAAETTVKTVELMDWIEGQPKPEQLDRYLAEGTAADATVVDEQPSRRWYPVIDFSRCTNCMECIDFCLFGVYGVDRVETILVEQPDNCRKGCPACSRVCPENAIIFPQHKTPTIAGSSDKAAALKIDLSLLFGKPDEDPVKTAVRERDEQLVLAGRDAVGVTVGIPMRQEGKAEQPKDELDDLIDLADL